MNEAKKDAPVTDPFGWMKLVPLSRWLPLCGTAGVPWIPAVFGPSFPFAQVYAALDGEGDTPELSAACEWVESQFKEQDGTGERWMYRWDDCAPGYSKFLAGEGKGYGPGWREVTVDDPRLFDCAASGVVTPCVRPWVEPLRHCGYPVEFRVYWGPDECQGVSNYYPQVSLTELPGAKSLALMCVNLAERLAPIVASPIGFTSDFLITPERRILFLEGGPPHNADPRKGPAHPCCFAPGAVSGVALSRQEGSPAPGGPGDGRGE